MQCAEKQPQDHEQNYERNKLNERNKCKMSWKHWIHFYIFNQNIIFKSSHMHVVGHCNLLFVGLEEERSCFEIERGCWHTCFKFTRIKQEWRVWGLGLSFWNPLVNGYVVGLGVRYLKGEYTFLVLSKNHD